MKLKTSNKNSVLIISLLIVLVIGLFSIKLLDKKKSKYAKLPVEYIQDTPLDLIQISLKEKHYLKLKKKRDKAISVGILETMDSDYVPATIGFNGKSYRADIRLKGDWTDHLEGDKWSFRVKLKGDQTIMGMRKFSIHHPKTRGYTNEWFYHKVIKEEELFGLRYEFLEGAMHIQKKNGTFYPEKNLGIYAIEETFDKRTIESNKRKESVILKFSEELWWQEVKQSLAAGKPYGKRWIQTMNNQIPLRQKSTITVFGEGKVLADSSMNNYFKLSKNLLESLRSEKTTIDKVFDVKALAKQNAILNLFGAIHGTYIINLRFYYNPITSKLEPIAFDGNSGGKLLEYKHFMFMDQERDSVYLKELAYNLEEVSKTEFLQPLIEKYRGDLDRYTIPLKEEFNYKGLAIQNLKYNQNVLREELARLKDKYQLNDITTDFSVITNVELPKFTNWKKKNVEIQKRNNAYFISRLDINNPAFTVLQNLKISFKKPYEVVLKARKTTEGHLIGLRLQAEYPKRVDVVFDLNKGIVKGLEKIGVNSVFENEKATIKGLGNGWFECKVITQVKDSKINLIIGPTDDSKNIVNWESKSKAVSSVEILNGSLKIQQKNLD